jgi:ethanolamine permease
MPAEQNSYAQVPADYFAKRGLRRYAGVASLWALGVGAVISGHYSGWNLGLLAGGWGGLALAALVIAVMYLGLVFCIAEMGAALPHTGGAYSFARASMGPWGGFITGLCENVEYVLTPAVSSPSSLPIWPPYSIRRRPGCRPTGSQAMRCSSD